MQHIGETIYKILQVLWCAYEEETAYHVMVRLFEENFSLEVNSFRPKENEELSSSSLQSLDDLEASFLRKAGKHYKGYMANITETCDPENDLQLITKVQVAPNNIDDTKLLAEALPELKEHTDLDTIYTDGGYGSSEMDVSLAEEGVEQIQSVIRVRKPSSEKLHLSDFEISQTREVKPTQITCP